MTTAVDYRTPGVLTRPDADALDAILERRMQNTGEKRAQAAAHIGLYLQNWVKCEGMVPAVRPATWRLPPESFID
jgi:hypothetical protein